MLTGAWLCPQTYRALRAPLPPLEDAPPPPPGRAGWSREERRESAEIRSAPTPAPAPSRPGLGSLRCAGAARLLCGRITARPPGRSLSRAPAAAAARFFNVHRQ